MILSLHKKTFGHSELSNPNPNPNINVLIAVVFEMGCYMSREDFAFLTLRPPPPEYSNQSWVSTPSKYSLLTFTSEIK